ncbi:MAG TPA: HDIG domain-containing metalloprotein [Chroococcales cyanobacterium]|jgi:putative nucleotidyltransferase with HDIG domain
MERSPGITREEALDLLRRHVKNENMIKHCLASEAVMVALAKRLGEDEKIWGLAGLLHDLDVEITDLSAHGLKSVEILDAEGVSKEISLAIKMHNESAHGIPRSEKLHHALAAGESITGLITATTLVYPDKKLASVKPSSVVKRMKEKSFAASVDREIIRECEKIDLPLPEFAALAIEAMRGISPELGL